ncbi:hypothetical protein N7540_005048 [Penicillium herquei]|nr:hypothetical protein N7540_005048 [Penicillium herquei]
MSEESGILREEFVVHNTIRGISDVQWFIVDQAGFVRVEGSQTFLCIFDDEVISGNNTLLLLGSLACGDTVLGNILEGSHQSATTTVAEEDDFVDVGQFTQVLHTEVGLGEFIFEVNARHDTGLVSGIIRTENGEASARKFSTGGECHVVALCVHHVDSNSGVGTIGCWAVETSCDSIIVKVE